MSVTLPSSSAAGVVALDLITELRRHRGGRRCGYAAFAPGIIGDTTVPTFFGDVPPGALVALTPRERDVLRELGTGATNRGIAERLGLTEGTVRNYVTRILQQLGLTSRTQAALFARSQLDRT